MKSNCSLAFSCVLKIRFFLFRFSSLRFGPTFVVSRGRRLSSLLQNFRPHFLVQRQEQVDQGAQATPYRRASHPVRMPIRPADRSSDSLTLEQDWKSTSQSGASPCHLLRDRSPALRRDQLKDAGKRQRRGVRGVRHGRHQAQEQQHHQDINVQAKPEHQLHSLIIRTSGRRFQAKSFNSFELVPDGEYSNLRTNPISFSSPEERSAAEQSELVFRMRRAIFNFFAGTDSSGSSGTRFGSCRPRLRRRTSNSAGHQRERSISRDWRLLRHPDQQQQSLDPKEQAATSEQLVRCQTNLAKFR